MAGAGYKLFTTGSVLTAADVNQYLNEQTVMRFATTTARDTALTGVLAEGMICYIDADNNIYKYTGSAWVNVDSGSTSPLTTKGDLYTYSTADARLAVGNNGETLVADSSTSTGLRWQAANNFNAVIGGSFDIWQRGTSFAIPSTAYTYTSDRFLAYRTATGCTVSRQSASLDGFQYCARIQRDSGNTSTATIQFATSLETVESVKFANKPVVLSFWARKGADYSATSSLLEVVWRTGTGTDQKINAGYTGSRNLADTTITLTTSWQRFSFTATANADTNEMGVNFGFIPVGTASTNDYFEITGMQIEYGSIPTTFKRAGNTLAGELAACQRYYIRLNPSAAATSTFGMGYCGSTTSARVLVPLPVTMRRTGTNYLTVSYSSVRLMDDNNAYTISNLSIPNYQSAGNSQVVTVASTGMTQYRPVELDTTTSGYVTFDAEL